MNNIASCLNCCSVNKLKGRKDRPGKTKANYNSLRLKKPSDDSKNDRVNEENIGGGGGEEEVEKYSRLNFITYPILGLDDSGKTAILKKWQPNHTIDYDGPTIGANTEKLRLVKMKRIYWRPKKRRLAHTFILRDLAGTTSSRLLWANHCRNIGGIFYIIDCSNHKRIYESELELKTVVNSLDNSHVPVVIMANKQDKPDCLTVMDLVMKLNLNEIKNPIKLIPTSAETSLGLSVALESMKRMSREYRKQKRTQLKVAKKRRRKNEKLNRLSYFSKSTSAYESSTDSLESFSCMLATNGPLDEMKLEKHNTEDDDNRLDLDKSY